METNQETNTGTAPASAGQPSGLQILLASIKAWPLPRKIATAAVLLISIGLFAFLIIQSRVADQQLLYANLSEEDAATVVNFLKNKKVPFTLKNGGKNIWIQADKI